MAEEKQNDVEKESESIVAEELPQPLVHYGNNVIDSAAIQQPEESPTAEPLAQETVNVPVVTTQEPDLANDSTDETTQESKPSASVTEKPQDELTGAQESPTKEKTPSDMQKKSVDGLPASTNVVEYITEIPTLQEEVTLPGLQEFNELTTNNNNPPNQQELQEMIEEEEILDREEILARCREALSEQEKLKTQNHHLQHKLTEYLARKKTDERTDASNKSFGDQEQRYMKSLNELETLQKSYTVLLNEYLEQEKELSDQCAEKQAIVEHAYEESKQYKLDKSCTAVYSRTGKKITKQEMEQLESAQKKKETELITVRLDNIKLQYKVQKCETQLKQKEELAEGLHMIDFEQLKIDNVNLNEKIEERNEDIIKLKKKITNAVQVLTHLKQKLQFVQVENCSKKEKLKQIESVVAQKRDLLTRTKQTRDALRMNNNSLRHKGGLVSHSTLLRDFEERKDQNDMLQEELIDLQNRHSSLILACDGLRKKIEQAKLVQS